MTCTCNISAKDGLYNFVKCYRKSLKFDKFEFQKKEDGTTVPASYVQYVI